VGRRYKPVELPLKAVAAALASEIAECPDCCRRDTTTVLGRLGLRLVFRCERCKVRFFRHQPAADLQFF
jgi:hypothetical protein